MSKEGILLIKEKEVKKRWKKHFAEVRNRPPPSRSEMESEACEAVKIETGPVTHARLRQLYNKRRMERLMVLTA